jgi:putative ABC transport system ATP-binding protein
MDAIVKMENVSKDYKQGDIIVHAIQNINLAFSSGEFTAMAGPSGSGKSTMLNIIGGMLKPTRGSVKISGDDITRMSASSLSHLRRDRIGFVFQNYSLIPVLTAFENAEYVLMLQGMPAAKRREIVLGILDEVGLGGLEKRFPRELSGGQQQRVAIARAIASEPALVLADEPTANVDSKTGAALLDLMRGLNESKGTTFLFATHEKDVMLSAKRLILLKDGQVVGDGDPVTIIAST